VSIYSSTFPPHPLTPSPSLGRRGTGFSCPDRCKFFILGWRLDLGDKEGKKTRGKNRTEFGSVKLTTKSRNTPFFVKTLPCLLVYLSSLSYLNPNLKKPTLVIFSCPPLPGVGEGLGVRGLA